MPLPQTAAVKRACDQIRRIAEGFAVTGAVADAKAAVAGELGKVGKTFGVLNMGDEEMGAEQADAGRGAQTLVFGELEAGLTHQAAELGLTGEGLIQQLIKDQGLGAQRIVRQFF